MSESGLDPSACNALGYVGLNQVSSGYLVKHGIDPSDYVTWSASQQLQQVVLPFIDAQIHYLGKPITSPGVLYGLNFLPARVKERGTSPSSVLTSFPEDYYTKNTVLDTNGDGAITIGDLDARLYKLSQSAGYRTVLKNFGVSAPYTSEPDNPSILVSSPGGIFKSVLVGGLVGMIGFMIYDIYKTKPFRHR